MVDICSRIRKPAADRKIKRRPLALDAWKRTAVSLFGKDNSIFSAGQHDGDLSTAHRRETRTRAPHVRRTRQI